MTLRRPALDMPQISNFSDSPISGRPANLHALDILSLQAFRTLDDLKLDHLTFL